MFCFLCCVFAFGLVWFSIRGRCHQLSLTENHTQVAFSHLCFVGVYFIFCSVFYFTVQDCSFVVLLFVLKIKMNTYHAALWSFPSYDNRYRDKAGPFSQEGYWVCVLQRGKCNSKHLPSLYFRNHSVFFPVPFIDRYMTILLYWELAASMRSCCIPSMIPF